MSAVETASAPAQAAATMPGFRDVSQVAIITRNAEATIRAINGALCVGSWKVATLAPPALFNTTYAGEPCRVAMKVGITWVGEMLLEVIEPLTAGNVYADYLEARGDATGVEHILLQLDSLSYEQAMAAFSRAGYPPKQHGQMNAAGRMGNLTVPPLPRFLAPRLATRFCYTSTQEPLKLDVELARFAFGVSYRAGLRIAAAEAWLPDDGGAHYETAPPDGILADIDAVGVLGRDLEALVDAYSRLTDRRPDIERFEASGLPGRGRLARIGFARSQLLLIEPQSGPLAALLAAQGEGPHLLRAVPKGPEAIVALAARGWAVERGPAGAYASHVAVPFALWIQGA